MRAEVSKTRILGKKMLAAVMAAASLCTMGCAKKTDDDTFVMIDVGYIDSEQEFIEKYGVDGTYVTISGFVTPEPIVTPVPTPEPTIKPKATKRPEKEEKDEKDEKEEKEEKKDKEEKKPEPTPTPNTKKVGKTPYSNSYEKVSIDYVSSSEGVSFQTTTFDGETVSESLFAKNGITMVNIWTQA